LKQTSRNCFVHQRLVRRVGADPNLDSPILVHGRRVGDLWIT
jgi:hypothetical protein